MLRVAHLSPGASPVLVALKLSLIPTLSLTFPSIIRKFSSFPSFHAFLAKTFLPDFLPWWLSHVLELHLVIGTTLEMVGKYWCNTCLARRMTLSFYWSFIRRFLAEWI
ncbi:hypothetical protein PVL29_025560 [Vitis rotundifolia]|uniref:Uncharacterized protein n=1 Tax=Vitis rotundifolia TaxID=103349 RepID=A0AA38YK71_VITRO|nr:hypothetical protein PVL29_025560 [Vitis rotundifolia]